ncbi:MAG TPA: hypothetical protein DCL42_04050, partial [Deltaproteobacteria bacterium]|nr:hypothetical protein [Deltaproteobacteria bacterium]
RTIANAKNRDALVEDLEHMGISKFSEVMFGKTARQLAEEIPLSGVSSAVKVEVHPSVAPYLGEQFVKELQRLTIDEIKAKLPQEVRGRVNIFYDDNGVIRIDPKIEGGAGEEDVVQKFVRELGGYSYFRKMAGENTLKLMKQIDQKPGEEILRGLIEQNDKLFIESIKEVISVGKREGIESGFVIGKDGKIENVIKGTRTTVPLMSNREQMLVATVHWHPIIVDVFPLKASGEDLQLAGKDGTSMIISGNDDVGYFAVLETANGISNYYQINNDYQLKEISKDEFLQLANLLGSGRYRREAMISELNNITIYSRENPSFLYQDGGLKHLRGYLRLERNYLKGIKERLAALPLLRRDPEIQNDSLKRIALWQDSHEFPIKIAKLEGTVQVLNDLVEQRWMKFKQFKTAFKAARTLERLNELEMLYRSKLEEFNGRGGIISDLRIVIDAIRKKKKRITIASSAVSSAVVGEAKMSRIFDSSLVTNTNDRTIADPLSAFPQMFYRNDFVLALSRALGITTLTLNEAGFTSVNGFVGEIGVGGHTYGPSQKVLDNGYSVAAHTHPFDSYAYPSLADFKALQSIPYGEGVVVMGEPENFIATVYSKLSKEEIAEISNGVYEKFSDKETIAYLYRKGVRSFKIGVLDDGNIKELKEIPLAKVVEGRSRTSFADMTGVIARRIRDLVRPMDLSQIKNLFYDIKDRMVTGYLNDIVDGRMEMPWELIQKEVGRYILKIGTIMDVLHERAWEEVQGPAKVEILDLAGIINNRLGAFIDYFNNDILPRSKVSSGPIHQPLPEDSDSNSRNTEGLPIPPRPLSSSYGVGGASPSLGGPGSGKVPPSVVGSIVGITSSSLSAAGGMSSSAIFNTVGTPFGSSVARSPGVWMAAVISALTSRLRYISALIYNYTKKAFIVVAGGFEKAIALINEVVERILGAVARTLSSNSPFSDNTARNIAGSPVEITAGNPAAQSADIGSNRSLEEPSSYTREVNDWHNIKLKLRSKIHGAQGP